MGVQPVPTELMTLNRALKVSGLRPMSPAAFDKVTQHIAVVDLIETAKHAIGDERSRQWLMTVVSKGESAVGSQASRPRGDDRNWKPLTVHVYGNQAALCFEPTESAAQFPTIAIDAALKHGGGRTFDWEGKIQINLTRSELVEVTATLLGFSVRAEGRHHGPAKNKGFKVENQGRHYFFEVSEGDKPKRGVQILPPDAHYVASLMLRQLRSASPWLSVSDVVSMLRCRSPMFEQRSQGG